MKTHDTERTQRPRIDTIELLTHPRLWSARQRMFALFAIPLIAAVVTFAAVGAGSPPAYKAIALSSDPLYATTSGDKPALALALSVEYPTVGAQYVRNPGDTIDDSYANTTEYLGYYDAEACYVYNNTPAGPYASGMTATDYKRFDRSGPATDRKCNDAFSGNFLNWASSSAIDMLRLALSGGDRYVDTADLTILQRAVLPNGDPICMWNSSNFPAKQLRRNGGSSGSVFFGAVPNSMATQAGGSDIWVANTLNRMYFGTSRDGGCGNTNMYTLGGAPPAASMGPVVNFNGPKPATVSTSACANENGSCTLSGTQEIWYGANSSWAVAPATGTVNCTNGVFGDPISGTAKQCFLGPYSGTWTPSGAGTGLNTDGFFYSRVQVCSATAGALDDVRDYTFCTKYSNGNFKPTGVIQKYSDQLRLSAFGYLMDQTASYNGGRYGGVLRAPMKYVGTKTFDINGQENTPGTGNAVAEWDPTTGVFKDNPDNDATFGISGVVNYLNKFGRTGPTPGRYKIYDPISELYYESLRYLQGLQPSPDAVTGATVPDKNNALFDGFPVHSTWTDPYGDGRTNTGKYGCLKSNIVVIGDINTHDNNGNRWPAANAAGNIPNLGYWNGIVGAYENGSVTGYLDGQGNQQFTAHPSTSASATNGSPRLDGIVGYAYWAHTHDIRGTEWTDQVAMQRPGLRVKTFTFDVNEYGDQTNDNTRRYRNQLFTAAKYGGFESDPSNADSKPYNTFGDPYKRQDGTPDDNVWQDAARPGEAGSYYLQSSARGVLKAFDSIFSRASTSARSIAGSAIQSRALTQAGSTIYQGAFDTSNWTGDLLALPVTVDASNNVTLGTTANWSAATRLTARASPETTRNIFIGNAGGAAAPTAFDFVYANLPTAMKADLDRPAPAAASDGLGADRVAFLRGNISKDGAGFRQRNNKLLGDIINSGVAYSGTPSTGITAPTYPAFVEAVKDRTPAVFVGANDGMLHAFDATTGDELFGYIPSWLSPKLSALTATTYVGEHQSYVDGPPVVSEAQVGTDWKTVLVSGTGAGGRGVFALDVTRPESFTASNAMWEFTGADDPDMGFVVGQPQILKLRTSASGATATYKWFAVVASGVDNYLTDSAGNFSATGNPALFLLDLAKPSGTGWTLGTNYFKISMPVNAALSATTAPGVVNFKAALGSSGEVTYIFAGDLQGNMWKFDFRAAGTASWNIAGLTAFTSGGNPYPLYIAKDGTGKVQPISMAPSLIAGETPASIYVAFGTGKYLEATDRSSTANNSFYVIHDNSTTTADGGAPGVSVVSGRGRLAVGAVDSTTGKVDVPAFVWGRATSDADATQRSGWYFDYVTAGERQISGASLAGDVLVFGSLIPGSTGGTNVCGVTGGSGKEYRINVDTGDGDFRVSTVGILGQPLVTEIASATTYTKTDSTGRRVRTTVSQVFNQGSGGIAASEKQTTTSIAGRLSWRQINNYQDLKQ